MNSEMFSIPRENNGWNELSNEASALVGNKWLDFKGWGRAGNAAAPSRANFDNLDNGKKTETVKSHEDEVVGTFQVAPGISKEAEFKRLTGEEWPGVNYVAEFDELEDDGYDNPIENWVIRRKDAQNTQPWESEPAPIQEPVRESEEEPTHEAGGENDDSESDVSAYVSEAVDLEHSEYKPKHMRPEVVAETEAEPARAEQEEVRSNDETTPEAINRVIDTVDRESARADEVIDSLNNPGLYRRIVEKITNNSFIRRIIEYVTAARLAIKQRIRGEEDDDAVIESIFGEEPSANEEADDDATIDSIFEEPGANDEAEGDEEAEDDDEAVINSIFEEPEEQVEDGAINRVEENGEEERVFGEEYEEEPNDHDFGEAFREITDSVPGLDNEGIYILMDIAPANQESIARAKRWFKEFLANPNNQNVVEDLKRYLNEHPDKAEAVRIAVLGDGAQA